MPGGDGTGPAGGSRGRRGFGMGPGGDCICPNCGHREPHQLAVPCYSRKCPKCGAPMSRA
jgi:Na+-translocating ferredoxin:NAD+ oxidoreductase subunit B